MAWYRTGTVALTNGSGTVTGSGTAFIANASIGEGFLGPDGNTYEITDIASNTSLTISPVYNGSTASGQAYAIAPLRGRIAELIAETSSLLSSFADVRDGIGAGLFPDGSAATPALRFTNDQDTGIFRAGTNAMGLVTGGVERVRLLANGRVGIGVTAPTEAVEIGGGNLRLSGATFPKFELNRTGIGQWALGGTGSADNLFHLLLNNAPVVTVDTGGKVGVGAIDSSSTLNVEGGAGNRGARIRGGGSTGLVIIDVATSAGLHGFIAEETGPFRGRADNGQSLGTSAIRWSVLYAGTGTINTSDARAKHWRGSLNEAELRAAKRIITELGIYQWNDAVAEKGGDGARLHFGVRAQQAFAIMEDEGLDWGRYAWACYDEWGEQTEPVFEEVIVTKTRTVTRPSSLLDPATGQPAMVEVEVSYEETEMQPTGETRVTLEAGDRYGVRPDQLAFWLIAAQAAMQADLEARIAALEGG